MNWLKERVGIQEPIYGSSAIQSVSDQAKEAPSWTELKRSDLAWATPNSTCVETQTFYATTEDGHVVMAQIIYNCLAGIRTTCQFNSKVFYPDRSRAPLWTSDTLEHWGLDESKTSFHADDCKFDLSEDGSVYTIKSSTSKQAIIDLKFTRAAPGFVAGKDGTSFYGTDPKAPWGKMRHAFWPRCRVEGSFMTQGGELPVHGLGIFIHALQGFRPNLAASSWNFLTFQSPNYSAVAMEFTTPPSYGSTKVTVGGVATDGKILCAGGQDPVAHLSSKNDAVTGWPDVETASFNWQGKSEEGLTISADLSGSLGARVDRVDVLAQIPKFLKVVIAAAAGSKPFIYQYAPRLPITVKIQDEEQKEEGQIFMEATFITA